MLLDPSLGPSRPAADRGRSNRTGGLGCWPRLWIPLPWAACRPGLRHPCRKRLAAWCPLPRRSPLPACRLRLSRLKCGHLSLRRPPPVRGRSFCRSRPGSLMPKKPSHSSGRDLGRRDAGHPQQLRRHLPPPHCCNQNCWSGPRSSRHPACSPLQVLRMDQESSSGHSRPARHHVRRLPFLLSHGARAPAAPAAPGAASSAAPRGPRGARWRRGRAGRRPRPC
mmetsp:Transcript_54394/g.158792  ORF Transcript_54394/g.158792 Transcript_54394/m.158792 type:complete len:223 (-) Transcript_54394:426-1094(-)